MANIYSAKPTSTFILFKTRKKIDYVFITLLVLTSITYGYKGNAFSKESESGILRKSHFLENTVNGEDGCEARYTSSWNNIHMPNYSDKLKERCSLTPDSVMANDIESINGLDRHQQENRSSSAVDISVKKGDSELVEEKPCNKDENYNKIDNRSIRTAGNTIESGSNFEMTKEGSNKTIEEKVGTETTINTSNSSEDGDSKEPPIAPFDEWTKEKLKLTNGGDPNLNAVNTNSDLNQQNPAISPLEPLLHPTITKRNYASKECGAKVLLSNDEAEFKTAILNDKERDIYMRNPCDKADQKFVVVELCETIVPMTVELANFELFSSGPNLFKVYISERFPSADWVLVGEFEMQNNRDIQKFALKKTGVFAKYIKLELLSHWGKEHYCTLSMVRIFGVSMVDEYEAEASAISAPPPSMPSSILSNTPPILIPSQISVEQPSESTEKDVKVDDENTTQPVIVKTLVDKVVNAVGSQIEGIIRTVMSNGDLNATKIKAIPPVTLKEMCAIPKANSSYELCYFFNHVIRYAKVNDVSLKKQEQKRPMPMARNIDYLKQRDVYGRKKKAQRRLLINQRVKALKLKKEEVKTIEKKIIIQNGGDHSLPAASTNYKESVFLKLSKRLSNLELNISLSSEYLGELSKRYVQQTNDNKKMHENTIKKSEDLVKHMMLKFKKELSRDVTSLRKELIKIRNFSKHSPKSIFENALSVTEKPSTIPDECMAEPTLLIHQGNDNIWTTEQVVYVALSAQCFTIFTIFLFQYIFSRMSRSKELKNDEVEVLRKEIEKIKKEIKDKNVETSSNNVDQFANKKRKKRNRKLVIHVDNEWDSALDVPSIPSETPTPSEFSLESDRLPLPSSVHDYHNKNMINNGFQIHSNKKNSKLKKMNINFIK